MLNFLENYAESRENNFDFLRFMAAIMVLFSHSYPLSCGKMGIDPLQKAIGIINFGELGVAIFFVTSGFLITKSYLNRDNLIIFLKARFLRVFPGLIANTLFCIFILGPIFTSLPIKSYFSNQDTWLYITHNISLINIRYNIPGIFINNPFPVAVNGSLWTLPLEFSLYLVIAIFGIIGLIRKRKMFNITLIILFLLYIFKFNQYIRWSEEPDVLLIIYFMLGSLCYINRRSIPLSSIIFGVFSVIMVIMLKTIYGKYILALYITYFVFFIAFNKKINLNNFGRFGDFSYGIYIYAFPIQQVVAHIFKGITPIEMFFSSLVLTIVLSIISWKFIEKPILRFKDIKLDKLCSNNKLIFVNIVSSILVVFLFYNYIGSFAHIKNDDNKVSNLKINNLKKVNETQLYKIDFINGIQFNEKDNIISFRDNSPKTINISGWAVDLKNKKSALGVYAVLDDSTTCISGQNHLNRKDVADFYKMNKYKDCGFNLDIDINKLQYGNHKLSLIILLNDKKSYYEIKPDITIRIEK